MSDHPSLKMLDLTALPTHQFRVLLRGVAIDLPSVECAIVHEAERRLSVFKEALDQIASDEDGDAARIALRKAGD